MFCTAISCMDGRIQKPVHAYLEKKFNVPYVDTITEPGPNLILARQQPKHLVASILDRMSISVELHESVGVAIVGHHDCARNPAPAEIQKEHIRQAVSVLKNSITHIPVIGLWVDESWIVHEVV